MPKKILQITNKPAYPSVDGGCLGMAKMSGFYDSHPDYKLDILTLETFKHPYKKEEFDKNLTSDSALFSVPMNTKPTFSGAVKALATNRSYNLSRFKSSEFEKKLKEVLTTNTYDIIQLENIFVAQYIPLLRAHSKAKIVLNSANIEYEIWQRMAENSGWLKNNYFQILAKQLKKEEEGIWKQVDGIICATEKDRNQISQLIATHKLTTLPFYLELKAYPVSDTRNNPPQFFHIGAMDWLPNQEGIEWLINNVWTQLPEETRLYLAGKGMPKKILDCNSSQIHVTGFVDDALDFMNSHDVMLVPLFSGSGIRVKIIEAMALGKCVISTSMGAEGINYTHAHDILIADSQEEFVQTINKVSQNPELLSKIGQNARKLIETNYDVALMESKLTSFLDHLNQES